MDVQSLRADIDRDVVRALISDFADTAEYELSPREILVNPASYIAGRAGHGLGKLLGLAKRSDTAFDVAFPVRDVFIAFVMVAAKQGIEIEELGVIDGEIAMTGQLPGNWAVFEGEIGVVVADAGHASKVSLSAVFAGQLFTWGEGPRRIKRIREDLEAALAIVTAHDIG